MKRFSLLYGIGRAIIWPSVRIFYRNIQIKNSQNFPARGAVFICSNHVNAFIDPVALQLHSSRQIYSLARGDAFNKPFLRWLLTQWKLIPIYRLSEGVENLKKNDYTFAASQSVLSTGNPLVIYPEAVCVQERRIRKLRKGAARIAFGVEEKADFKAGLIILPLGLNYSDPTKIRSNLFMNFGEPLFVSDYTTLYKKDNARAINELTSAIEKAMKGLVVNIADKVNDPLVENLYTFYKPELLKELKLDPENLEQDFELSREIANAVNHFQISEPQLLETLRLDFGNYKDTLEKLELRDLLLSKMEIKTLSAGRIILNWVMIILGIPFFLAGLIMNYFPYKLGKTAADKLAKEVEFHASINMIVGWISWLVYFFLQLLIVALAFHKWLLLGVYALAIPLSGFYALRFYTFLKKAGGRIRLLRLRASNREEFENLQKQRAALFELLNDAKLKYCNR